MSSLDRILPFLQPIAGLLTDPTVTEVMVNEGGRHIFVERDGALAQTGLTVDTIPLTVAIQHIARSCRLEITEAAPILDARLEDGSRVAAMFPPCAVDGPTLTIRRFGKRFLLDELVTAGTLTLREYGRLVRAVEGRQNILISGGAATGKTTLLNALMVHIPPTDRVALIEDTTEIFCHVPNLIRFEARPAQTDHGDVLPAVTIADLLKATLRHRPDRIVVGEIRGGEAFDLLQAWNTGHQGSLSTIHANSAPLALTRLAHCALMAGVQLSLESVKEAVRSAVQFVVHLDRVGPLRKVTGIHEVQP